MTNTKNNVKSFSLLMILGMFLSVFHKNENAWDLANYHYYNAWAFLNNRTDVDIVPAFVNTFFNPLIDLPLYFYIKYFNNYPTILYAFQGIWCGLFLFMLYKIGGLFFNNSKFSYIKKSFVIILVVTAQATCCQIGASTNEIPIAFFILWGLYILLKMIKFPETQTLKKFLLAGLIMGIGLGLKQTVVTYCVASGITLMICHKYLNKPFKSIFCFALGGLIGYLIINGYFMYKYWILYQNPFFPFLNGIFKSPYFFDANYRDRQFIPKPLLFFVFPFTWNIRPMVITEGSYYDLRLTLFYILPIFLFFIIKNKPKIFHENNKALIYSTLFCFLSLLLWMEIFSIMRYAVIIECVGAFLWIKVFDIYNTKKHFIFYRFHIFFTFILIISALFYPSYSRSEETSHLDIQEISLQDNTLIKIYGLPTAFIIPDIAKNAKDIKTITYYKKCLLIRSEKCTQSYDDFAEYGKFKEKRDKIEKEHSGPVIYVYVDDFNPFLKKEKIQEDYLKQVQLCRRAAELKFIKNSFDCLKEKGEKYINDLAIAEEYGLDDDDYYCQKLQNNLNDSLNICVPEELKTQILGEEND